jgi:L-methionine (R)-S-oxide reductase
MKLNNPKVSLDYFFCIGYICSMHTKAKKYHRLASQLKGLLDKSPGLVAQMSTINAILYHKMQNFFWVGFYFVNKEILEVGPYQGAVACQVLKKPNGVCWASVLKQEPIIVEDVAEFPGHIACDSRSKSEIVIPVKNSGGEVIAIFDIDSDKLCQFDEEDKNGLIKIISLINQDFINRFKAPI